MRRPLLQANFPPYGWSLGWKRFFNGCNRDSIRKAREAFLIQKGRTIDPDGLNVCEETYKYYLCFSKLALTGAYVNVKD